MSKVTPVFNMVHEWRSKFKQFNMHILQTCVLVIDPIIIAGAISTRGVNVTLNALKHDINCIHVDSLQKK